MLGKCFAVLVACNLFPFEVYDIMQLDDAKKTIILNVCICFHIKKQFDDADPYLFVKQIFNGVFLKVNKAIVNMVHRVEPYVTYGYVNFPAILI